MQFILFNSNIIQQEKDGYKFSLIFRYNKCIHNAECSILYHSRAHSHILHNKRIENIKKIYLLIKYNKKKT